MYRFRFVHVAALTISVSAAACSSPSARDETAAPASAEVAKAAPAGAMCAEHGVLEAVCTKCNPKLIPVFKAKGDWCEEHGFPMSFCPIHHPERGGRPVLDVTAAPPPESPPPADGTKVRLGTKDTARMAGLETVEAVAGPGGAGLTAPATIVYDATRVALVNARSPGVVRAVKADVGTVVTVGMPLALIDSAAVATDRSRLVAARTRVELAEAVLARAEKLVAEGVASAKEVAAARMELESAKAERAASVASLGLVSGGGTGAGGYVLAAPIAGIVTARTATIGRLVGTEEALFEVVDVSMMWAELDIPETRLGAVAIGRAVTLAVDGLGERRFSGTIAYLAPEIDRRTRTAKARVRLTNPDGVLRANMFATARIDAGGTGAPTVLVPREAVQRARGVSMVFVRLEEDLFEARHVEAGVADGELVPILRGIRAGERVVTKGSFLLKTETLKESIGAGCCEADAPKK